MLDEGEAKDLSANERTAVRGCQLEDGWAEWDANLERDAASGKVEQLFGQSRQDKHQHWCNIFNELPMDVQEAALQSYELLKADPYNPSLRFRRVGAYWSVRAGPGYRALATEVEGEFIWSWIGSHADYKRILG